VTFADTSKQGAYVWVYTRPEQVVLAAEDEADIGRYSFNNRILSKTFCRRCGVLMTNEYRDLSDEAVAALNEGTRNWYTSAKGSSHPVNLRVLNDFDLSKVRPKVKRIDGRNIVPGEYVKP
jgi:hypothetical protein